MRRRRRREPARTSRSASSRGRPAAKQFYVVDTERGTAREPVCPRCLDIEPGIPAGDPPEAHPGPFSQEMCGPCHKASAPPGLYASTALGSSTPTDAMTRRRLYYGLGLDADARGLLIDKGVSAGILGPNDVGYDLGDERREFAFQLLCKGASAGFFESDAKADADYPSPIKTNGDLAAALARREITVPMTTVAGFEGATAEAIEFFALFGGAPPAALLEARGAAPKPPAAAPAGGVGAAGEEAGRGPGRRRRRLYGGGWGPGRGGGPGCPRSAARGGARQRRPRAGPHRLVRDVDRRSGALPGAHRPDRAALRRRESRRQRAGGMAFSALLASLLAIVFEDTIPGFDGSPYLSRYKLLSLGKLGRARRARGAS